MSWVEKSIDELGRISRGRSRHRPRDAEHLFDGPYPFVQTGDVKHAGLFLRDYRQTYSEAGLAQSKLWPIGTLCITIAANIADTSILAIEACFPDSVIGFIADPKRADTRFIKYLFDATLKLRYKQFTQGVAQDNLSQDKLVSIKFSVPEDVSEQTRIANFISNYDEIIENNRRRMQLLVESARLLYQEWFVALRFPGHEHVRIVDGIPEGWRKGVVADFYDTSSGGTPSRKSPDFYTGTINWVKTQELGDGYIFDTDEKITEHALLKSSARIFPEGTVLVAMYGATIGELGILGRPAATNQACCAILPKQEAANPIHAYLFFALNKRGLVNLSQGAAQPNISQQIIRNYPMLLPAAVIMELFLLNVEPLFSLKRTLALQNIQYKKARDLLLPRLMNREIAI